MFYAPVLALAYLWQYQDSPQGVAAPTESLPQEVSLSWLKVLAVEPLWEISLSGVLHCQLAGKLDDFSALVLKQRGKLISD